MYPGADTLFPTLEPEGEAGAQGVEAGNTLDLECTLAGPSSAPKRVLAPRLTNRYSILNVSRSLMAYSAPAPFMASASGSGCAPVVCYLCSEEPEVGRWNPDAWCDVYLWTASQARPLVPGPTGDFSSLAVRSGKAPLPGGPFPFQ